MIRRRWVTWALAVTLGCSPPLPEPLPVPDAGPLPCTTCAVSCPQGFIALDAGAGCVALLPATECPAGSMPVLGSTACKPVGVRACAPGFITDSSGWGCRDVIPATPCVGATREKLGSTTCVPVSDCAAPFPPAGATLFVSAQYTAAQLDATHFNNIHAAVAAADAGVIIAIDDGTYGGTLGLPRPVSLVGRCAERVVLVSDGGATIGLRLVDIQGAAVRNLTLKGFAAGIAIFGGSAELSGLVLEDNTIAGLLVSNAGASVRLTDSVIRRTRARPTDRQAVGAYVQRAGTLTLDEVALSDNEFAGIVATGPDAGVVVRRAVIRDTFPLAQGPVAGTFGVGAYVADGAWMELEESAVLNNTTEGVLVARAGTRPGSAVLRRCTVRDTKKNPATDNAARGIEAGKGASLVVDGCTAMGNAEHEILVTDGASAVITNTTTVGSADLGAPSGTGLLVGGDAGVVATSLAIVRPRAVGIGLEVNGALRLEDSLLTDPVLSTVLGSTAEASGFGISAKSLGALTMSGSVVRRAAGVGILLSTASATITRTLVLDTQSRRLAGGRSVSVQDGSTFTAVRSAFIGSHETGIATFDPGSRASLTDSSIEATQPNGFGDFGIGVLATTGSTFELSACTVTGNKSIGIAASSAAVALRASFVSSNQAGIYAQEGVTIFTGDTVDLKPNGLSVSNDTRFVGNGVVSGLGAVPLPSK